MDNIYDPHMMPFFLEGKTDGEWVLMVNGFTGSPASVRPLAEHLNHGGNGYNVLCMLLPAHGTHLDDLFRSRWKKWFLAGW